MAGGKLTPKQERFCQEYIVDLNASAAYVRAGYSTKNANVTGPRLLANVGIAARIAEIQQEVQKRTEITQDAVLKELALMAFGRIADVARTNSDGHLVLDFRDATDEQKAIITGIKTKSRQEKDGEDWLTVVETEVKAVDKVASLKLLMQHMGMLKETVEHTGKNGGPILSQQVLPDMSSMSEEELRLYLKMAEKAHGSVSSP